MVDILIVILGFGLAFIKEAKTDFNIISNEITLLKLGNPEQDKKTLENSVNWHKFNWQYLAIISLMVASILFFHSKVWLDYLILISVATLKVLVFNPALNIKRGLNWKHLGDGFWEKPFKKIPLLYYGLSALIFIGATTILILKRLNYV